MAILTADMKRAVDTQLGFVATVCPDGTPNLSPKGTTAVWDDDHLVFAHMPAYDLGPTEDELRELWLARLGG